jgi:hypothetical protein
MSAFTESELQFARNSDERRLQHHAHRYSAEKQAGEQADLDCTAAAGKLSSAETDGGIGTSDAVTLAIIVGAYVIELALFRSAAIYVVMWATQSPILINLLSAAVPAAMLSFELAISKYWHRAVVYYEKFGCKAAEVWSLGIVGFGLAVVAFGVVAATQRTEASLHGAGDTSLLLLWALPVLALAVHSLVLLLGWRALGVMEWAFLKIRIWRLQRKRRYCERRARHDGEVVAQIFTRLMNQHLSQPSAPEPMFDEQTVKTVNEIFGRPVVQVSDELGADRANGKRH